MRLEWEDPAYAHLFEIPKENFFFARTGTFKARLAGTEKSIVKNVANTAFGSVDLF